MARRVLIMGVSGMLGHTLMGRLARDTTLDVYGTARDVERLRRHLPHGIMQRVVDGVDATDVAGVRKVLRDVRPEIVVNCIGIVKQDAQINDAVRTISVNSLLPHLLAREAAEFGARLIHVSTDCVFSGTRGNYIETDVPDPHDFYGRSKLLGEVANPPALTLRTSIIGHELLTKRSLLEWFLTQSGSVNGFTNAVYTGVTTTEVARLLSRVVFPRAELVGLFHVASKPISKYDLLHLIAAEYAWAGDIKPFPDFVCDRSLSGDFLYSTTGYRPPAWVEMIADMHQSHMAGEEVFD